MSTETERVIIIDPSDEDKILSVVESTDNIWVFGIVLLNPDGTKIGT